jgi:hypothetical protein
LRPPAVNKLQSADAGKSGLARPKQVHHEENKRQGEKDVHEKARHVKCNEGADPYHYEEEREKEK